MSHAWTCGGGGACGGACGDACGGGACGGGGDDHRFDRLGSHRHWHRSPPPYPLGFARRRPCRQRSSERAPASCCGGGCAACHGSWTGGPGSVGLWGRCACLGSAPLRGVGTPTSTPHQGTTQRQPTASRPAPRLGDAGVALKARGCHPVHGQRRRAGIESGGCRIRISARPRVMTAVTARGCLIPCFERT